LRPTLLLALALCAVVGLAAAPPMRIAALAPHVVEMLFLLGAGDRIVATVDYADHPPAARDLPRVGDASALSLEALVASRPDLVVAWGAALDPERRARLEAIVPELLVSEPQDLAAVADELDVLAGRLGLGGDAARAFRRRLEALEAPEKRLRVLPLISLLPPMTLGRASFVDDVLRRCGAENPFATEAGIVMQLSREVLLVTELDYVLPLVEAPPEALEALFGRAPAILSIDPDLLARPGPRLLDGAESLCTLLAAGI
jgi:ABC-type hemin transport system substrate-binding protein